MGEVIVLGVDPGIAIVGFGIVEKKGHHLRPVQYGSITTKAELRTETRLKQIYEALGEILTRYKPDVVAVEKLFFNRNVTTALTVGQARGVIMLAAEQHTLPLAEYTPLQVKQAVVGYGAAEKQQVQEMVRTLLKLKEKPRPDDVADALAVAICHAHSSQILTLLEEKRSEHD
jgi:crossover junction endodeoxyribonuclease RuvC